MTSSFFALEKKSSPPLAAQPFFIWSFLLSFCPFNLLGFLVIHDVHGYLGESGTLTPASLLFFGVFLFFFLFSFIFYVLHKRPLAFWLLVLGKLILFCPLFMALIEDWFVALFLILINSLVLIYLPEMFQKIQAVSPVSSFREQWKRMETSLSGLATIFVILIQGYKLTENLEALVLIGFFFFPYLLLSLLVHGYLLDKSSEKHRSKIILTVLPFPLILLDFAQGFTLLGILQGFRFLSLLFRTNPIQFLVQSLYHSPAQLMSTTFFFTIMIGTILLLLPLSSASGKSIKAIDALFTSTSATCVTGLAVLDTGKDFSLFGQAVILVLIQVGGLGFMTLSTFAALVIGKKMGLTHQWALASLIEEQNPSSLYEMVYFIIRSTFVVEAVGALLLAYYYYQEDYTALESLGMGIFHGVSAFCNAGFALHSDSLMSCNQDPLILLTISFLIWSGGIGFVVLSALWLFCFSSQRSRILTLHHKLALGGTFFLLGLGTLSILALEWSHTLKDFSGSQKVLNAFFQSVTTRTAGFNSIALDQMQPATVFLFLLLMFIGACPGSTGGGVKVTTVFILLLTVHTILRGRSQIEIGGKTIPMPLVFKSTVIVTLSLGLVCSAFFLLLVTQSLPFVDLLFETISAFATVGLSLGITAKLNTFGKLTIIFLMFIGRIGPLTLALLLETKENVLYRFPEENVSVG